MRSVSLSLLLCLFSMMAFQSAANAEEGKWVEIKVGFANIYKQLDPESDIIKQAKKGDRIALEHAGTSWYKVKVDSSIGWIEKRSGKVVSSSKANPLPAILLILVIIGGTTGGIVYFSKNKPETAEV